MWRYLDRAFWRMAFGLALILGFGLLGVYYLSANQGAIEAGRLTWQAE